MRRPQHKKAVGAFRPLERGRQGFDPGRAVDSAAGDAVEARGLDGFGKGHIGQDGEAPGQHRLARPERANEEEVVGKMPASSLPLPFIQEGFGKGR
jgi:hypothetical protein